MQRSAHIVAARRSPVAPRGGDLATLELHALAAPVIRAVLGDAGIGAAQVDEIIVSNALGAGGNPARLVALAADLPQRIGGYSIDRQCCGGLDALALARAMIVSGQAEIVLAGGVETYSQRPIRLRSRYGAALALPYDRPAFAPVADQDPDMDIAADQVAQQMGIDRAAQDAWARLSHQKAQAAQKALAVEIVALGPKNLDHDSYTRRLSPELCARAPILSGSITHANSAVAADAAAFSLVVSDRIAAQIAAPSVAILQSAALASDPAFPALAPVPAIREVLQKGGVGARDLAQVEMMEAYAAQALACIQETGLDPARCNIKGGALARGHPIGASGAILAVRLFHDLRQSAGQIGLAAIAAAGGLGSALLLQSGD